MRLTIFSVMLGLLLLLPAAGPVKAEPDGDCQAQCAAEKASSDGNCVPADQDPDERAQCLQDSQQNLMTCLGNCPQPAAAPDSES